MLFHTVKSADPRVSSVLGKRPGKGDEKVKRVRKEKNKKISAKGVFIPKKEWAARWAAGVCMKCGQRGRQLWVAAISDSMAPLATLHTYACRPACSPFLLWNEHALSAGFLDLQLFKPFSLLVPTAAVNLSPCWQAVMTVAEHGGVPYSCCV